MLKFTSMENLSTSFDQKALSWDDDPMKQARASTIAGLIRPMLPRDVPLTGLEYGCGTGLLSFNLQSDLAEIHLADTSEGMLEVLRTKILEANIENFYPVCLDLTSQAAPTGLKVDVIFSLMTLHHVMDTKKLLDAFSRIINSGGFLFIADLDKEDGSFHPAGTEGIHFGFERSDLKSLVEKAGFELVSFIDAFVIQKNGKNYPVFLLAAKAI